MAEKKKLYRETIVKAFKTSAKAVKETIRSIGGETQWERQKRLIKEQRRTLKPTKK